MSQDKKIAIIVQRCGENIAAGAEVYAFSFAKALAEKGLNVEVLTSKSDDYINWNNRLPDEEWIKTNGKSFLIKRYPVLHGRFKIVFAIIKRINFFLSRNFNKTYQKLSPFLDYIFLKSQGPWCPSLWNTLQKNTNDYSLIIVKSYLYSPNYYSIIKSSNKTKTLFIVTAHDEPEFKLNFVSKSLSRSTMLGFVSNAEKKLCNKIWLHTSNKDSIILPPGITQETKESEIIRKEIQDLSEKKYFIYLGRIDKNKNVDFIFNHTPKECLVVFAGDLKYEIPNDSRFLYLGRISELEKKILLQKALALIIASRLEAYSIVTAEAIYYGCLVLALKGCEPIDELINQYGGVSCNAPDFKNTMLEIWEDRYTRTNCEPQRKKIAEEKSWEKNVIKIIELINAF
jgi:glycosyltransferase involved in cell wall biosynthesis